MRGKMGKGSGFISVLLSLALTASVVPLQNVHAEERAFDVSSIVPVYDAAENKVKMTVPSGYTVENNGADFEQIVGDDFTVHQPLTDKEVRLALKVTDPNGSTVISGEHTLVIPGLHGESSGNEKPKVVPEIAEWYSDSTERFYMTASSRILISSDELQYTGEEFQKDLEDLTGRKLPIVKGSRDTAKPGDFCFSLDSGDEMLGEEGYTMVIDDCVVTEGIDETGVYWGTRTILQAMKLSADGASLPEGCMRDYPRYPVRSFVFDVGRKAVSMDMLKDVAKNMAWYKMNDFQVHLNDNYIFLEDYYNAQDPDPLDGYQGYTGYRLESSVQKDGRSIASEDYHYTKEEFREFIQECRRFGVNIVPEIDVPAHAMAITEVFPEYAVNSWNPRTTRRSIVDHLDISRPEVVEFTKSIYDDYTKDGTFDQDTIIHIGADEFESSATAYREFLNTMLPYIKQTNTVRLWGGLTWIVDNKTEVTPEAVKGSQINLWSKDWADGQDMYNLGFDLINTLDTYGYMVPSGGTGRGAYQDYVNKELVYSSFAPNKVRRKNGSDVELPSGDKQVLGGAFALWQDYIDKRASGLSEEDLFLRFYDALPLYAEKTWAVGNEKGSVQAIDELAEKLQTAPNTNPYRQEKSDDGIYAEYSFEEDLSRDESLMDRNLSGLTNAAAVSEDGNTSLKLQGGTSYAETPLQTLGSTQEKRLSFTLKLEEAVPGQILFEADAAYGTHDIRIMSDGKLGFTRELYEYEFDYEPSAGAEQEITIVTGPQKTALYVNGSFVSDASGRFVHNGTVKKTDITNASFALPLQRIGSAVNAVRGTIDNIRITDGKGHTNAIPSDGFVITSDNENALVNGKEGPAYLAFDGNEMTIWHSDYTPKKPLPATVTVDLGAEYEIDRMFYLPRQDSGNGNGIITQYSLSVSTDGTSYREVSSGALAEDAKEKEISFEPVHVRYVRFTATAGKNNFASAAEITFCQTTDRTELREFCTICEDVSDEGYTPDSWKAFQSALEQALKVLGRENPSQEKVDEVLAQLKEAKKALTLHPVLPPVPDNGGQEKPQDKPVEKPGEKPSGQQNTLKTLPEKGSTYQSAGLKYRITESTQQIRTAAVTGMGKKNASVTIPAEITVQGYKYQITSIADRAFRKNTKLKKVVIGKNIVKIGKESFSGCKNLKSISIKSSKIRNIGKSAFSGISGKAVIQVPKKKLAVYRKYLKKAKLSPKVKVR